MRLSDTCNGAGALFLQDMGNFKEAREAYDIAVQKNPDNPHCYHLRGQCYLMQGMYDQAMTEFSTAISVNPRCAGGPSLTLLSCSPSSAVAAQRTLSQAPSVGATIPAHLHCRRGHSWRASDGGGGGSAGDYYGRGDCYRHQGRLNEAMNEYSHALKLDPQFAGACWGRGDCLLAQVRGCGGGEGSGWVMIYLQRLARLPACAPEPGLPVPCGVVGG
jgi:tetratricopeptide (TPR) repeat protein